MKIFIVGITGAMGRTFFNLDGDFEIAGGFAEKEDREKNIYNNFEDVDVDFDVIIDFSNKSIVDKTIKFSVERKKPLVEATTGLSEKTMNNLKKASEEIPVIYSRNYSLGINVMEKIVSELTKMLDGFDIEIIEAHHNKKKDAPSGTALMLLDAVKKEIDVSEIYDRTKIHEMRNKNEVGISSIRAGTINGDHTVIFAGDSEILEIKHSAGSKNIFANGAIKAAKFLLGKEKGLYNFKDILE